MLFWRRSKYNFLKGTTDNTNPTDVLRTLSRAIRAICKIRGFYVRICLIQTCADGGARPIENAALASSGSSLIVSTPRGGIDTVAQGRAKRRSRDSPPWGGKPLETQFWPRAGQESHARVVLSDACPVRRVGRVAGPGRRVGREEGSGGGSGTEV